MSGKPSASCICTETPFFSVSPRVNDLDHYLASRRVSDAKRALSAPKAFSFSRRARSRARPRWIVDQEIRSTGIPRGLPAE
jgi:hypothetical protein